MEIYYPLKKLCPEIWDLLKIEISDTEIIFTSKIVPEQYINRVIYDSKSTVQDSKFVIKSQLHPQIDILPSGIYWFIGGTNRNEKYTRCTPRKKRYEDLIDLHFFNCKLLTLNTNIKVI